MTAATTASGGKHATRKEQLAKEEPLSGTRGDSMSKSKPRDQIPVVIDESPEPNPRNPHALSTPADRQRAMRNPARTILLRKVKRILSN